MATNKLQRGAVGALVVGCGLAVGLAAYFAGSAGQAESSDGVTADTAGQTQSTPEPRTVAAPGDDERRAIAELQPLEGDVAPLAPTAEVSSQPPNTADTPAAPAVPSEDEIARMSGSELRRLAERLLAEHEVEIDAEIERRFSLAQYDYVIPQGDPQPKYFGKVVGRGDEQVLRIVEMHRVRDARFYDKQRRARELEKLARSRP